MRILTFLKSLIVSLQVSLKRFPLALLMAAATSAMVIYINHLHYNIRYTPEVEVYTRLALTFALGIPIFLSLQVLDEKISLKRITKGALYIGAVVFLILNYLFLLAELNFQSSTRYAAITISLYLVFTIVPYYLKRPNFELYVIKLITGFFTTYLFAMVLFLGLAAIISTINFLFNANISGNVYFDIWVIVAGVFAPAYFLANIPGHGDELDPDDYSKIIRILLQYIVTPLLTAYSMVLYAYFARLIFTGDWPKGLIVNLTIWYGIVSALTLFLIYPLKGLTSWVKGFVKWYPRLILPILAMMFISLGIRINAYGLTEARYFAAITGIWIAISMIYLSIKREARNILLPILIVVLALVAVLSPLNAYTTSINSQNRRFEAVLKANNMVSEGRIIPSTGLTMEEKRNIAGILRYFERNHSFEKLKLLPKGFSIDKTEGVFGFSLRDINYYDIDRGYFSYYIDHRDRVISSMGFDYLIDHAVYSGDNTSYSLGQNIVVNIQNNNLLIRRDGAEIYRMDLEKTAIELHQRLKGKSLITIEEGTVLDENESVRVKLVAKNLGLTEESSKLNLNMMEFYLLVKIK